MVVLTLLCPRTASQPARAVWIEIVGFPMHALPIGMSQPARAVWIEINCCVDGTSTASSHSLRGLCGLKWMLHNLLVMTLLSQPARAVWIEIARSGYTWSANGVTACEGCVD